MLATELFHWGSFSFHLDISNKLNGLEKAFGLKAGEHDFKKVSNDLRDKFDKKLIKWRPSQYAKLRKDIQP